MNANGQVSSIQATLLFVFRLLWNENPEIQYLAEKTNKAGISATQCCKNVPAQDD